MLLGTLLVHHRHLDCFQSDERGARWKRLYGLHVELGLAVQPVSLTQTEDNGRESSGLAFTPAALTLFISGQKHRLGLMQWSSYLLELKEYSQQKEGEEALFHFISFIVILDCTQSRTGRSQSHIIPGITSWLFLLTKCVCMYSFCIYAYILGFSGGTSGKEPACQRRRCKKTWVWSLGWEDALEEGMAPTPVFLPGESHGQRTLVGYSPWGRKSQTWLSD